MYRSISLSKGCQAGMYVTPITLQLVYTCKPAAISVCGNNGGVLLKDSVIKGNVAFLT